MVFSISAVALFGIVLALMLRFRAVSAGGATVAALFGFFVASTGIAPVVNSTITDLLHALPGLH
ncbi:hypothetical protein K353_02492 [Kitasatospora sp. SolWspMP-SS2h]|uniref:hypothetical protein n=1 Tax=Kitasatospora sp. SolWspMP-SS2h TaxID=1305729 RepID=UPI000DBA3E9C|nr:hypothetical protein [Kitasatospora sp. SolWspMP-SS2h]RAJ42815.1 hypothetical protein K353_02492 [Kitasatospora sp. SolWspMP-SS2h]